MISAPAVPTTNIRQLTETSRAILRVICYYDMFKYPVKAQEIRSNMSLKIGLDELKMELDDLEQMNILSRRGRFYFFENNEDLVVRRLQGNLRARSYMRKARSICKYVAKFPFVRGIYISGSLSKGYIDEEGDIDYFVVTKPNRLWFTKGLLALIKKVFLLNSKKYFCFNYFVDETSLKIPDENLFTAVELTSLVPMYNDLLYGQMIKENEWALNLMPNFERVGGAEVISTSDFMKKQKWEKVFSGRIGNWIDTFSMKMFEMFWRLKYRGALRNEEDVRIRCKKNVSKVHPNNFQDKVLKRLDQEYAKFEENYKLSIVD